MLLASPEVRGYKVVATWGNGKDVVHVTFKTPTPGTTETIRLQLSEGSYWAI
jgi:hypothetical protein